MMEILAENCFTITKSLFYEGMLRVSKEGYGKNARKVAIFLGALWLALVVVTMLLRQSIGYALMELIVFGAVALWLCVGMPRYNAKKAFKTLKDKYGDELERVTRFFADRLEVETVGCQTVVYYSEIEYILLSKRLLVLVTEDKTGILVPHDGFKHGSTATVRELIPL